MTESMIVEAVRAAQPATAADPFAGGTASAVPGTADPNAVARFQSAMGMGAQDVNGPDPIPFASEASAVWRNAQENHQGILHRIRALSQLGGTHGPSTGDLVELQYEVMNLTFQQEVVTKVADKSSNAIQTLVKNQ